MNIKYLNEKLVAILNTGFHLQRNAYKSYIFTLARTAKFISLIKI